MKRIDFDPTSEWKADQGEPGAPLVMAVFGCQIYELSKCAAAVSETNVLACARMIEIRDAYADKRDDFRPTLQALPMKTVLEESKKLTRYKEDKLATSQTAEACENAVSSMTTVRDLCDVVVNLASNAKSPNQDTGASIRWSAILSALEEFEWGKCEISKFPLVYMGVLVYNTYRSIRC